MKDEKTYHPLQKELLEFIEKTIKSNLKNNPTNTNLEDSSDLRNKINVKFLKN